MDPYMTTHSPQDHAYPVDVEFPDLSGYAAGNTGIPYVHTFDSGVPGTHVMINALTHGNEVCGAITVKGLLDLGVRPRRGKLTLAFSNIEAYLTFDASKPDASRFVDQDFNRVWTAAKLDDTSTDSSELRRARALRPVIDTVDALLDLHSMHERSAPLIVSGPLEKGIALSRALGAPATVISDEGHPEGRRMRDYEDFGDPQSTRNALLVECGQRWSWRKTARHAFWCWPVCSMKPTCPPTGLRRSRPPCASFASRNRWSQRAWISALRMLIPVWRRSPKRAR
jgi:predicted deacylase